ncbi:MAG TPA: hypothetical protein VF824_21035 [Thermoanaerobaculia bacterium]|jgi:hypothetical protein
MKDRTLMVASLLSIVFSMLHLTEDIVRGIERGGVGNLVTAIPMYAIWLYATLILAGRRSGYIIVFLGSLIGLCIPASHMIGRGLSASFAKSPGAFFFISGMLLIGVTSFLSILLCVNGLWRHSSTFTSLSSGRRSSSS